MLSKEVLKNFEDERFRYQGQVAKLRKELMEALAEKNSGWVEYHALMEKIHTIHRNNKCHKRLTDLEVDFDKLFNEEA